MVFECVAGAVTNRPATRIFLAGLGMVVEERKDIRSPRGEHTAMIASGHFDVLVRHLQVFHLFDPSAGARNRH